MWSVELHGGFKQSAEVLLGVFSGRQFGHSLLRREDDVTAGLHQRETFNKSMNDDFKLLITKDSHSLVRYF